MEDVIINKISDLIQLEWVKYNSFLDEFKISALSGYYLKDGEVLNYEEVKKLYEVWLEKEI